MRNTDVRPRQQRSPEPSKSLRWIKCRLESSWRSRSALLTVSIPPARTTLWLHSRRLLAVLVRLLSLTVSRVFHCVVQPSSDLFHSDRLFTCIRGGIQVRRRSWQIRLHRRQCRSKLQSKCPHHEPHGKWHPTTRLHRRRQSAS